MDAGWGEIGGFLDRDVAALMESLVIGAPFCPRC